MRRKLIFSPFIVWKVDKGKVTGRRLHVVIVLKRKKRKLRERGKINLDPRRTNTGSFLGKEWLHRKWDMETVGEILISVTLK